MSYIKACKIIKVFSSFERTSTLSLKLCTWISCNTVGFLLEPVKMTVYYKKTHMLIPIIISRLQCFSDIVETIKYKIFLSLRDYFNKRRSIRNAIPIILTFPNQHLVQSVQNQCSQVFPSEDPKLITNTFCASTAPLIEPN